MRPSIEARYGVAALLFLQLATSVAGVVLLGRMSPAVQNILEENVYSTQAVEEMLAELAMTPSASPATEAYKASLQRARGNITEAQEVGIVDALDASAAQGLEGGPKRQEAVRLLQDLGAVNRASMRRADERAQRLGLAGAWAMALLGFGSFLVSWVLYRRLESRLLAPVLEVAEVLAAVRAGDTFRRCTPLGRAGQRGALAADLNWLLDRKLSAEPSQSDAVVLRECLLTLADGLDDRLVVVGDATGQLLALNRRALDEASEPGSWTELGRRLAAGDRVEGWSVERSRGGAWVGLSLPDSSELDRSGDLG